MALGVCVNRNDRDVPKAAADVAEISLSHADEDSIRSLAEELHEPFDLVAEIYRRELARLRRGARVTTFLPQVVSRLVRRRGGRRRSNTSRDR
jgi:hypothetical protein